MRTWEACGSSLLYSVAGTSQLPDVSSDCHLSTRLPCHGPPKDKFIDSRNFSFQSHTDTLIALQCNLDVTRCNVLFSCAITDTINPIYLPSGAIPAGPDGNSGRCRDVI
jgi:hypothetical protein